MRNVCEGYTESVLFLVGDMHLVNHKRWKRDEPVDPSTISAVSWVSYAQMLRHIVLPHGRPVAVLLDLAFRNPAKDWYIRRRRRRGRFQTGLIEE